MSLSRRAVLCTLAAAAAVGGCGAGAGQASTPVPRPWTAPPLSLLVTSVGLQWLVFVEPAALAQEPAVARQVPNFAPPARLAAFERLTGIDLLGIRRAVVASYGRSQLYLLEGVADSAAAAERFRDGLQPDMVQSRPCPDVALVQGRSLKGQSQALAALGKHVVAIETGARQHARLAAYIACGRLRDVPAAMQLGDIPLLDRELGPAPLRAFAPGPFTGRWQSAVGGLLGACTAVAGAADVRDQQLELRMLFAGAWEADAPRAAKHVLGTWQRLVQSPLGGLTGLREASVQLEPVVQPEVVGVHVRADATRFLAGLHAAVRADAADITSL